MTTKKGQYVRTSPNRGRGAVKGQSRATLSQVAQREGQVEQLLLRRLPESQIVRLLAIEWRCGERNVWTYLRKVRERWMAESKETRAEQRVHMRRTLNDLYSKSINAVEVPRGPDGRPLLDPQGRMIQVESPDLHAAARTAKLLIDFDGLAEPTKVQAEIVAPITVTADVSVKADREALTAFLKRKGAGRKPDAPK